MRSRARPQDGRHEAMNLTELEHASDGMFTYGLSPAQRA